MTAKLKSLMEMSLQDINADKCESVVSPAVSSIHTGDICISVVNSVRCCGGPQIFSGIDANIKKARGPFFARGSGVFVAL